MFTIIISEFRRGMHCRERTKTPQVILKAFTLNPTMEQQSRINKIDYGSYRCAVALSNIGVSLLEKRAYPQAVDTLKDAVAAMKCTIRTDKYKAMGKGEDLLEQAYRRIATPSPVPGKSAIEVLTSSGLSSTVTSIMHRRHDGGHFPACFPIKIENFQSEDVNIDLDSSIVLHNFATAYLCLSRVASTRRLAHHYRDAALKLAKLAHMTLSDLIKSYTHEELDNRLIGDSNIVLIAASVLNTIVRIQLESGKIRDASVSFQRLRLLGTVANEAGSGVITAEEVGAPAA